MIRRRHAIPPTLTSIGYLSTAAPLCAGPANALTGWRRYQEVYLRARHKWGRRASLRHCWAAYRFGVVLSGDPHGNRSEVRL